MLNLARGLPFKNLTGSTIGPGYAIEITGTTQEEGEIILSIQKPTTSGIGKKLIVYNGECDVVNNGGGFAQAGPLILAFKNGTPALGDVVGPVDNQWYVSGAGSGFIYLGVDPTSCFTDSCILMPSPAGDAGKFFVTTSTITARTGTSAPYTYGSGTGTMLLAGATTALTGITLKNGSVNSIASGRLVQCKMVDGDWVIDVDYCN